MENWKEKYNLTKDYQSEKHLNCEIQTLHEELAGMFFVEGMTSWRCYSCEVQYNLTPKPTKSE